MACSSCQKNKQVQRPVVERQRAVVVNQPAPNVQESQITIEQQPASPKFQIPKILPPLKG